MSHGMTALPIESQSNEDVLSFSAESPSRMLMTFNPHVSQINNQQGVKTCPLPHPGTTNAFFRLTLFAA